MSKLEIKQRPFLARPENFQGVPSFLANILARRGVASEQELELKLKHLLAPTMQGLPEAIQIIDRAIDTGRKIVIVGDYDADGATSTDGSLSIKTSLTLPFLIIRVALFCSFLNLLEL